VALQKVLPDGQIKMYHLLLRLPTVAQVWHHLHTVFQMQAVAILGELQNRKHIQRIKLCILALEIMPEILQQPAEIHI